MYAQIPGILLIHYSKFSTSLSWLFILSKYLLLYTHKNNCLTHFECSGAASGLQVGLQQRLTKYFSYNCLVSMEIVQQYRLSYE